MKRLHRPVMPLILTLAWLAPAGADEPAKGARPVVEFRPARSEPAEGFVKKTIAKSTDTVYVQEKAGWALAPDDVAQVLPETDERKKPAVTVKFTPRGSEKMGELTGPLVGQRLAILVDGKVVSAPAIRSKITSAALISGSFTDAEVETISRALRVEK